MEQESSGYTHYTKTWKMREVIPYILKHYFKNHPTSNKDLREAFWRLMGKDLDFYGKRRWTSGDKGVPYHIHGLVMQKIIAFANPDNKMQDDEYPEYSGYLYILGDRAADIIKAFKDKYGEYIIDYEMKQYLG